MIKLFIVEDDAIVSQDMAITLQSMGYAIAGVAGDGHQAISLISSSKPDLILMDIRIKGGLDGVETAKIIQAKHDIPIIYITACIDELILQKAKMTAPFGYLLKPFNQKALRAAIEIALFKHRLESETDRLNESAIQLTRDIDLTINEKKVFYAIVTAPDKNDLALSNLLELKRSTVTAIRNRLKKEDWFKVYKIPNLQRIGCGLLAVVTAEVGILDSRCKPSLLLDSLSLPEEIAIFMSERQFVSISAIGSSSDFKADADLLQKNLEAIGFKNNSIFYLPIDSLKVRRFFDFSHYLKGLFNLDFDLPRGMPYVSMPKSLNRRDKLVLYSLLRFPEYTDSATALELRLPRTTISQTRRKLERMGMYSTIIIPNLQKLRSELLVAKHIQFKEPGISSSSIPLGEEVVWLNGDKDHFSLSVFQDYSGYERHQNIDGEFYAGKSSEIENCDIHYLTNSLTNLKKIDFVPLARKLLGIASSNRPDNSHLLDAN